MFRTDDAEGRGPGSARGRGRVITLTRAILNAVGLRPFASADAVVIEALESVPYGLCVYDGADRLLYANRGFCVIYGHRMDDLPFGIPFHDVLKDSTRVGNYPSRSADEIWRERKAFIDKRERGTFVQALGDGRLISISHQPLGHGGWAAVYEDITARRRTEMQLRFLAHHDALTMLPNRVLFGEQLDAAVSGLLPGDSCAILYLDLDGFKPINDRLGHAAGDELLRSFAERLQGQLREGDMAARLGGDEFAVLLPIVSRQEAEEAARRFKQAVSAPYVLAEHGPVSVGASIGIASAPRDGTTYRALMAFADADLYEAKRRWTPAPVAPSLRILPTQSAAA